MEALRRGWVVSLGIQVWPRRALGAGTGLALSRCAGL